MPPPSILSAEEHDVLDKELSVVRSMTDSAAVLFTVLSFCHVSNAYNAKWPMRVPVAVETCRTLLANDPELENLLILSHKEGKYSEIRERPLKTAYATPYRGHFAEDFLATLSELDEEIQNGEKTVYAKARSLTQSSAAGKSRLLTECGRKTFTLPICLRRPGEPGYPLSDNEVYTYFQAYSVNNNDLSMKSHIATACFIGAAHKTMLRWLKKRASDDMTADLHDWWYRIMEQEDTDNGSRKLFFEEVIELANDERNLAATTQNSPKPTPSSGVESEDKSLNITDFAEKCYEKHAKKSTEDLIDFIDGLDHQAKKPLVVTYIDEAHNLGVLYWILLRLLGRQDNYTRAWWIFLGTKSSLEFYNPSPVDLHSLRLRKELAQFLPPYIAFGFDQNVIFDNPDQAPMTATMGELQSIKHLCKYGRPIWNAQYREGAEDSLVGFAAFKLINCARLDSRETDHVFSVLSQRICVDTVVTSSEATKLANRSVSEYMRILTGFSSDGKSFYTYSPSEPLLALGAAELLHNEKDDQDLAKVLNTFSHGLCKSGLVEKGLIGELASRILFIVARDRVAPLKRNRTPDLLQPVLIIDFFDTLFGNKSWHSNEKHPNGDHLRNALEETYINFTHWILTRDSLPETPSKTLLANLWARGAALQCSFNQESLDLLIVTYTGSVVSDEIFDVERLSAMVVQIKYKTKADTKAEAPRNSYQPLPYIVMVLELGNESSHQTIPSRIRVTSPPPDVVASQFEDLQKQWTSALQLLQEYKDQKLKPRKREVGKDQEEVRLLKDVEIKRLAMDAYNRYTISVRGASPEVYGVLKKANIAEAFATLLSVTLPSPTAHDTTIQQMKPLERLGATSAHTDWMSVYVVGGPEDSEIAIDSEEATSSDQMVVDS
ncbi:hypothetical protein M413DRAFT_25012 [Hebeloma cylindrosporum]|uniref:Uncharacterized protein n=1 Tax=Hebeloma cylindrosporum TaxID=76867 RepID=A0A0C2YU44_HEBCY|nr:hypothetical protein M413DRAFT_25012 [Hebeloma cylindrosporum h7]